MNKNKRESKIKIGLKKLWGIVVIVLGALAFTYDTRSYHHRQGDWGFSIHISYRGRWYSPILWFFMLIQLGVDVWCSGLMTHCARYKTLFLRRKRSDINQIYEYPTNVVGSNIKEYLWLRWKIYKMIK